LLWSTRRTFGRCWIFWIASGDLMVVRERVE
jgi:hypothetical protein